MKFEKDFGYPFFLITLYLFYIVILTYLQVFDFPFIILYSLAPIIPSKIINSKIH